MSQRKPKRNKHYSRRFLHPTKGFRTHDAGPRVIDRMGGGAAMLPLGQTAHYRQMISDLVGNYSSKHKRHMPVVGVVPDIKHSIGHALSKVKGLFSGRGR